jgi:hypothetical protein
LVAVYVFAVFGIVVHTIPSADDSQFKIVPVYPLRVNRVLLIPAQTIAPPVTEPPKLEGSTVTDAIDELTGLHILPL